MQRGVRDIMAKKADKTLTEVTTEETKAKTAK